LLTQEDFRLKAMTFDNVPWVITMKKNDHYFPMTDWTKDPSEKSGWRRTTYEMGTPIAGESTEGVGAAAGESFDPEGGDVGMEPLARN
jgi:hypothetical protein